MLHHLGKKSQKGTKALDTEQKRVVLPCKRLITPVKYGFAYLIHSFSSLLENNEAINYLYGSIDIIPERRRG